MALAAALALAGAGCGGSDEDAPVRAAVQRYLTALGSGNPTAVCTALTPATRERLAELGEEKLRLRPGSCQATIGRLMTSAGAAALRRQGKAKIVSIELHGDKAEARIDGFDGPAELVRAGGTWRIEATPSGETD